MVGDYNNGKVYKIWTPLTNKIYIGSTIKPLCNRMSQHRKDYKLWLNGYVRPTGHPIANFSSFRILEIDPDCKIELLKKFPCNNKKELENEERAIMDLLDNCINVNKGQSSNPEYIKAHKNKKFNCECGGKYARTNKTHHYKSKKHKKYIDNL